MAYASRMHCGFSAKARRPLHDPRQPSSRWTHDDVRAGPKCNQQGTLAKRVTLRTQDVELALQQLRLIEWVGKARAILVGYSEGGNTTGNWSQPGSAAHMSMASACTSVGDKPAAPRTSTPAPETSWLFLHKGQHHSTGCVPCRHETERQTSDNSIDGGEYDPHQRGLVHRLRQVVAPAVPGR